MKRHVSGIVSLLLVMAILCTGCAGPKAVKKLLPHYAELSPLIGVPMEDALQKMGWQEKDLERRNEFQYKIPMEGEIGGVPFEIRWHTQSGPGKVSAIMYHAEYSGDLDAAIRDTWKVLNAISSTVGKKAVIWNPKLIDVTEEELREKMESKRFRRAEMFVDLSDVAQKSHKDFIDEQRNTDYYKKVFGNLGLIYGIYMDVRREEDTVSLDLFLCTYGDPNGHKGTAPTE